MWVSAALFFLPVILLIVLLQYRPEVIYSIYSAAELAEYESMYDPADKTASLGRHSETDLMMFGYYIANNVSIGFRTFASGFFGGIGAIVVLILNGVMIGAVAGHLTAIGHGEPFWRFVVGHSAPELLAIVIAGGAGLQLGLALIAPGQRSRSLALVVAGLDGAKLVLGVFVMLLFAAFVEAFWSSIGWMPSAIKFTVGATLWLLILAWLGFAGRPTAQREP
jgi:uncharacterized membrane protein SpoIIM required for sporulation